MKRTIPLMLAVRSLAIPAISRGQTPPLVIAWQAPVGLDDERLVIVGRATLVRRHVACGFLDERRFTCYRHTMRPDFNGNGI